MCLTNDLINIWRIRNPNVKRFTWHQKTPVIQRRLDFWLVSNGMQEDIDNVDVIPSLKSDHSAIVLSINGIENRKFDLEKDFLLVNHIFLLAKYFIYKCKLSQVIPTLLVFKAKLKATYKVELYIAKEKGILPNHYKKWDNFLSSVLMPSFFL